MKFGIVETYMMISLRQFNIQRPERINYDFPVSNPANLLDHIKSKSLRSFLLKTDEILVKNNIEWKYEDLTEEKFMEWLPYYKEKMEERNHEVRATKEWYQEQISKGVHLKGLFFYQGQRLVGSGIIGLHDNIVHFAYKASDQIELSSMSNSSIGAIIEFLALKLAAETGHYTTTMSRSRNAFGFFNTLGYLDYKLRFGYKPEPISDVQLLDEVPVNEKGSVLFYGVQNKEFILFSLQPESQKEKKTFDKSRFTSSGIPFKEIYY